MDNDKIITFEIPKGYKLKQRIFDKFVFERMTDRPTDIREALEILDLPMLTEGNYRKEQLYALQRLLIFRDAWWKMADDWKPDYKSSKHSISIRRDKIDTEHTQYSRNYILVFPTIEMRDEFYANFKELIEQCKELL